VKILAIEGALGSFGVALAVDGTIVAQRSDSAHQALERGLEAIAEVLQRAGVAGAGLDRIAVGTGPGGFTGLRIAISYAKALALGWDVPLVAISSYDIVESGRAGEPALAVVRGRPDVVCARLRLEGKTAQACGPPRVVVERLVPASTPEVTLFGDAEDVREALGERGTRVISMPSPQVAAAAAALLAAELVPVASLHAARPDYGELPAVTLARRRA
jgi:tRNA threonylcarbamoyladenosine biosynthesis protein TsaB